MKVVEMRRTGKIDVPAQALRRLPDFLLRRPWVRFGKLFFQGIDPHLHG